MKVDKAKIDELKAAHSSGIYEGTITFNDDEDNFHEVEFIYRKPSTADMESYTKASMKNPVTGG